MSENAVPTTVTENATGEPVEWWYINGLIEAPGTKIDGWALVTTMLRFGSAIEEGRFMLIPPSPGESPIDFGTRRLPAGSLEASRERVDVRAGANFFTGGYPKYELHAEGTSKDGTFYSASLSYAAKIAPEALHHVGGQIAHFHCARVGFEGEIIMGDERIPVAGLGFYERVHGSLGWEDDETHLTHVDGWNWYWSPKIGPSDATVEIWSFFGGAGDPPSPLVSISLDGERFHHFETGRREVLEQREFHGVPYPHKIRLVDSTGSSELDLTITRRDADARTMTGPGMPKRMYFVTGYSDFEGHAVIDGERVELTGAGFGSAYEMSTQWQ